ncbi:hypothetical protein A4X06_0g8819 [Tilletia controversa]|uniref:Uncharacterized protein n=1 Tax=Tilletia controversa TaxID=13291 RepID=A0A8X7SST9_9BASI|nr:hypothetical protein A4X06_0g8819 [Tilletia controversa]
MLLVDPKQVKNKRKFHLLTHLGTGIVMHGPAKNFATERYESFNSVARNASMCSNRGAPSRDIALRLYGQELIRRIILDRKRTSAAPLMDFASTFQMDALLHLYGVEAKQKELKEGSHRREE